jgi:hypothetical protein
MYALNGVPDDRFSEGSIGVAAFSFLSIISKRIFQNI